MGSFYGNYCAWDDEKGRDYDKLSNKPIINLSGSIDDPVIISSLDAGLYLLRGYYKFNDITPSLSYDNDILFLNITVDYFSQQKNVFFTRTEDNNYITYLVTYDEDNEYKISHLPKEEKKEVIYVTMLPPIGKAETLYVCDDSIYQYVDNKFINLSRPDTVIGTWGEF